jgi:DNA-binding SARP family transcriptional activator
VTVARGSWPAPAAVHDSPFGGRAYVVLQPVTPSSRGQWGEAGHAATLTVDLLGGFRVVRAGVVVPACAWERRSAKTLTKVLATTPGHAVHREQLFELLWPNASTDSARNSLAKALHAARHALEPERQGWRHSAYLYAIDHMIGLETADVLIDADEFQRLAHSALRLGTVDAYQAAVARYGGPLLPEDRYDDWPAARRRYLADLHVRLLLALAEALEVHGDRCGAIDCLLAALLEDQAREDAHRQLMRLYDAIGARDLALRQFEVCRAHLHQELNRVPDRETTALYEQLFSDRGSEPPILSPTRG